MHYFSADYRKFDVDDIQDSHKYLIIEINVKKTFKQDRQSLI